jgi:hypothetical protein
MPAVEGANRADDWLKLCLNAAFRRPIQLIPRLVTRRRCSSRIVGQVQRNGGDLSFRCGVHLRGYRKPGGIVVTKTLARLTIGIAAFGVATWFGTSASQAYGDAPWCAVITIAGDAYWNCQSHTVEECAPNVVAGNRGFCALNPWPGPSQVVPSNYRTRHTRY